MGKVVTTLLIIGSLSLAGATGCSREGEEDASKKEEKIIVAVTPWPASAALYVALHYKTMMRIMALFLLLQGRRRRPGLPGWSFLRFIYGGVLPPPAVPLAFARGQGFPP